MSNDIDKDINSIEELPYDIRRQSKGRIYDITFSEEVESPPFRYSKLSHLLREEVNEEDTVNIQISNYGGCCDSAATIVNAIKDCKGHVKCIVNASSYSAATMLALAGDELELKPYSFLMFHNFSNRTGGKGTELKDGVVNTERLIHSMMADLYTPFLTKKEIDNIFKDKDVYVHWDDKDLHKRLNKYHKSKRI